MCPPLAEHTHSYNICMCCQVQVHVPAALSREQCMRSACASNVKSACMRARAHVRVRVMREWGCECARVNAEAFASGARARGAPVRASA
eukprot:6190161-Pleurochrysis_carterae.AAC.1